jgi:phosphate transport system permease protein
MQNLFGLQFRLNALVGGIGLSIAVIPIIFTITEDALSAVPKTLMEASLAMGATVWESAYKVMLPAAFPGVFAAVLLGIGRAFGETMIALMATGNAAMLSAAFTDPVRTFSATIGAEMGEVIWGSPHYSMLFFLGVLLFAVSFTLNAITELFIKERLAKKLQGG